MLQSERYADADSSARQLLRQVERDHGAESLEAADAIDLIVEATWRAVHGASSGARELAERGVRIKERLLRPDDLRLAASWTGLARILLQRADHAGAAPYLERALKLQERSLGPDDIELGKTLNLLGVVVNNAGDEERARTLQERALGIFQRRLPPEDPLIAGGLTDLANVLTDLGDYEAARDVYLRSITAYRKVLGDDNLQVATVLGNLARLQHRMGEYAAARSSFERAIAIQIKAQGPESRRLGFTLTYLGLTLQELGDDAAARDTLERALHIRQSTLGHDHVLIATTLQIVADFYQKTSNYARARALYQQSLEMRERLGTGDDPNTGTALQSYADLLAEGGEQAEAESLSTRGVGILERAYGPKHQVFAEGLAKLAQLRLEGGDCKGARALIERALEIQVERLGPDHPDVGTGEMLLSEALLGSGDSLSALSAALEAERIARDHLRRIGSVLSESEALRYSAVRTNGLGIALTVASGSRPDSIVRQAGDAVIRSRAVVLDEMAARHRPLAADAESTIARLASVVNSSTRRFAALVVRGPMSSHPERFRSELVQARRDKEEAERALAERSAAFRAELEAARAGLNEVASALPPRSALVAYMRYMRAGTRGDSRPMGQQPDRPAYAVLVVQDQGRSIALLPIGEGGRVDALVARWSEEVGPGALRPGRSARKAEETCRTAGAALRRIVWDPVAWVLQGVERVYVVPDGAISFVAFAALPANAGGYLIDSNPQFRYLSAERDLAVPPSTRTKNTGLLALGGADFNDQSSFASLTSQPGRGRGSRVASSPASEAPGKQAYRGTHPLCGEFRSVRFPPLPGTRQEATEVFRLWEKVQRTSPDGGSQASSRASAASSLLLLGSDGSESAFKVMAPHAGVLHLATHGFFLEGNCSRHLERTRGIGGLSAERPDRRPSSEVGSSGDDPRAISRTAPPENPLVLCGLALAGANHRDAAGGSEEDGILTAEEIAAMDLSGVSLAVLSACDTGAGRTTTGEGVLGLRRAFQVAGVSTVVMSLWPVEDQVARRWMGRLYQSWLVDGLDPAESAQRASRGLLGERRAHRESTHPFYWAGFISAGVWNETPGLGLRSGG